MCAPTYGFQRGDVIFPHDGKSYYLRLTLGALAEICARLDESAPLGLAQRLRAAKSEDIASVLCALARPAHGETDLSQADKGLALTAIAEIIETAFSAKAEL